MNKNIKLAVNTASLILVPLFLERKKVKNSKEMKALGNVSKEAYESVKDTTTNVASSIKDAGASTLNTSKNAVETVSTKVTNIRQERQYKSDNKQLRKAIKFSEDILSKFESDKEKHRKNRLKNENTTTDDNNSLIPNIFKSKEREMNNQEKTDKMGFSLDQDKEQHSKTNRIDVAESLQSNTVNKNPDLNTDYNSIHSSQLNTQEPNHKSLNNDIHTKVKSHSNEEDLEPSPLHKKHRLILDRHADITTESSNREERQSLFNQHRNLHEENIKKHGRKTGVVGYTYNKR